MSSVSHSNYKVNLLLKGLFLLLSLSLSSLAQAGLLNHQTQSLAPVIKKAMPSVVAITGIKKIRHEAETPSSFFSDKEEQTLHGFGSGVIVDAKKGHILTNAHVISDLEDLQIRLHDKRQFNVEILGMDKATDLALLKIEADNLKSVQFADSDALEVGDFVMAIGNPYRLTHTVTSGIVSALSRSNLGGNGYYDFIQTDAAINMGNSGGGLFNIKGELVGINTMILSPVHGGNVGLAFAIPINMARSIAVQLAHGGRVQRSALGAYTQDLSPLLRKAFKTTHQQGALITDVLPYTPANLAGLQIGDIVLAVNSKPIKSATHLQTQISLLPPNSEITLKISRLGEILTLKALMKDLFDNQAKGDAIFSGLEGCILEESPPNYPLQGVKILHIEKSSRGSRTDLIPGDIIVGANQRTIPDLDSLKSVAKSDPNVLVLQVLRDKIPLFVAITK